MTDLDLPDTEVEEGHALADLDDTLGSDAAHRGTETTVELEDGELVEEGRVLDFGQVGVLDNLLRGRGLDLVPVAVR